MRVMLKRPLTDDWLDLEVRPGDVSRTQTLSTPGDITLTLPAEYHARLDEGGHPVLVEGETMVLVIEDHGEVLAAVVDSVRLGAESVTVSAGGVSAQTKDLPWTGPIRELVEADPLPIFREIWEQVSEYPNHVTVELVGATSSEGRIGTSGTAEWKKAHELVETTRVRAGVLYDSLSAATETLEVRRKALFAAAGLSTTGRVIVAEAATPTRNTVFIETDNHNRATVLQRIPATTKINPTTKRATVVPAHNAWVTVSGVQAAADAYLAAVERRDTLRTQRSTAVRDLAAAEAARKEITEGEGEPYEIAWHSAQDLSKVLADLAAAGPFEWVEEASVDLDTATVSHRLRLGAPRLGVRRDGLDDPRFELGVNVHEQPEIGRPESYTDVKVYGAGEGSATLHEYRVLDSPRRVRRVRTIVDKDAHTREQVSRIADAEVERLRRSQAQSLDTLVVHNHPNALPGTYNLGDEIHVVGRLSDGRDVSTWVRILEIARTGEDRTQLKVEAL